jgi:RHS repeat-associated protein
VTNLRLPGQYDERLLGTLGLQGPYYNWNRWYLPGVGRYFELDPMNLRGLVDPSGRLLTPAPDWYGYARANPLSYIDPLGLYGTANCAYYEQRCRESGGWYYCHVAQFFCNHVFPSPPDPDPDHSADYEGWPRCTRQCLRDCDRDQNRNQNSCPVKPDDRKMFSGPAFDCHVFCYTACAAWGYGEWRRGK